VTLDIDLDESSGPRAPRFSYHVRIRVAAGQVTLSETGARARAFARPLTGAEQARLDALLADYTEWRAAGDLAGAERRAGVSTNHLVIRDADGEHAIRYLLTQKADHPWLAAIVGTLRALEA
jgi:hypothetical protein